MHAVARSWTRYGRAHLIYQPGVVTLTRRHGRRQITDRRRPYGSVRSPVRTRRPPAVRTVPGPIRATGGRAGGAAIRARRLALDRAAFVAELAEQIRAAIETRGTAGRRTMTP